MNEQQVFEAIFRAIGVEDFQKAIAGAQQAMSDLDKVGGKLKSIGKGMTKSVTAPIVAMGTGIALVGKKYEASMSQVAAISGATGKDLDKLKEKAREMGATTRYSASESADALGFMALAGWDVEQMTSALPGVLNLATAGAMDLAVASDIVTDTMSMFGMEATDAGKASDIFAAAQSKSNTNVEQLSEALLNAGPAAAAAGADLEQTSAILGIFANQGVKGGRAGTALNAMFRDIKASAENGAIAIGKHSISVYDANGNMRAMGDIMADVEKATNGMTTEQRDSALADVFKQQSLSGVNLLLAEGSDALKDLENDIYNSDGVAQNMADTMDDNLNGALANMRSALEEVALGFYDMSGGPMTTIINKITELFQWFGNLSDGTKQWIGIIALAAAAIGPLLMLIGKIITVVSALGTFFVGTAGSASMFATILGALASPITLIIAGIAALVAVIVHLYNTNEEFRNKVQEIWTNIQLIFEEITMIISEVLTMVFGTLSEWWAENQQGFMDVVNSVWTAISDFFIVIFTAIGDIINAIWQPISDWYQENNELIGETISVVWNKIADVFMEVMTVIGDLVTAGFNIVSSVIEAVMPYVKTIIDNVMYGIMNVISLVMGIISGDWDAVWTSIKNIAQSMWNIIKAQVGGAIAYVKAVISSILDAIFGDWSAKWNQIKDKVSEIWDSIVSAVSDKIESVKTTISDGIQGALDTVTGFFDRFKEAGANIVGSIADGIKGAVGKVTDAIGGVVGKVRDFLPFSPAKEGPLKDLDKLNFGGTIADSIYDGETAIQKAMNRALDIDMPMMNGQVSHSVNMNNGRTENLLEQLVNSNQVIVLDSGELVGATYPQYDRVGGSQTQLTERWGR